MSRSCGPWSRQVSDVEQARAALAEPGDALDLRAAAALDERWEALGFVELVPGELVRALDVPLAGRDATQALGARLGAALRRGDLVVLSGPLGAGKTTLVQGLGAELGVRGAVTSPTFVLARSHRGPLPLVHVDAYRLQEAPVRDLDLLADLELEQALEDGVVVVEWGEGLVEQLSADRLHVLLHRPERSDDGAGPPEGRSARVVSTGRRWSLLSTDG